MAERTSSRSFDQKNYAFELGAIHGKLETLSVGQEEICRRLDQDVKARLDKVNGSVATLYHRTDENKAALLTHVIECPQKEKVERIEQKITMLDRTISEHFAAGRATETQSSQWKEKLLFPLIRIAVTGLVLILLYHAKVLLGKL
jgi:hypothetical protein